VKILIFVLLLIPAISHADIIIHLVSSHPTTEVSYNEKNFGIGYSTSGYVVGAYRNSINNTTAYLVKQTYVHPNISFLYGIGTGYSVPVLGALNLEYKKVNISITPPGGERFPMAVLLSVKL
jgi:hypothetical protein